MGKKDYSWWIDSLWLTFCLGGLFFILLGTRPLFTPDEGRYAEIAREMIESGDYVTPHLNYIKYFEKPILFYWLSASAIKLMGLNLWSLRSVNALFGLWGCLITYLTARRLFDRKTGLFAACILSTSALYFTMVHMISLDLPVTVFITTSLFTFLLGIQYPLSWKRRAYLWATAGSAGLAVLTKGLIGIVFPILIISFWIAFTRQWSLLKQLYLPSSLLIFFFIATPWHIIVGIHNPEFFYFYFIEQHILRYTTKEIGHYQPFWFFIPILLIGFFPWIAFLPQALYASIKRYQQPIIFFFLSWILIIFVFFSFSHSKLIPYILPIFPPLAILSAHYLCQYATHRLGIRIGYSTVALCSMLLTGLIYFYLHHTLLTDPRLAHIYLYLAVLVLMFGALLAYIYLFYVAWQKAFTTLFVSTGLFFIILLASMPSIDTRTILPFANIIQSLAKPEDDVITFNQYYQDLPFYLKRRITILNWKNELAFGMQHQPTETWMIKDDLFWKRWHSQQRVFVILSQSEFSHLEQRHPEITFYKLSETPTNVLISNQDK